MRSSEDSFQVNASGDFNFQLTKDRINPNPTYNLQASRNNNTLDDLQYSADDISYVSILGDLKKQQDDNQRGVIPNISAPVTFSSKEDDKKRQRKAIFERYKQKNDAGKKDVMELFDDVLRGKNPMLMETVTMNVTKKNDLQNTVRPQQVNAVPSAQTASNSNRMNPPPNLLKKNSSSQSPNPGSASPSGNVQYKTSNISIGGSFSINDNLSMIIGSGNNPFAHSRQSQQIAELLEADIFGSFQQDDKSQMQIDAYQNQDLNMLDDIKMSAIGKRQSGIKSDSNIILSGINLAQSQDINTFKKQTQNKSQTTAENIIKAEQSPFITRQQQQSAHIQNQEESKPFEVIQSQTKPSPVIINDTIKNTQPQSEQPKFQQLTRVAEFVRPSTQPISNYFQANNEKHLYQQEVLAPSHSQLSINSNQNIKSVNSNTNSNIISSGSLSKALGHLSQHVFAEPVHENRFPQLLRQCARLNSISINILSPNLVLDSLHHKQMIRSLIFQELMATQTLQRLRDELESREIKLKRTYKAFNTEEYLLGDWYQVYRVKNNQVIKPREPHPKRPVDFNVIKDTLKNSVDVLRYFQNFIQPFKIQASQQFKKKYIQLRCSLFDIFINLKKISEDLYMKSISNYVPEHYYKFYEYLKNSNFLTPNLPKQELHSRIQQREKILLQIDFFKNEHDFLACSSVCKDIQSKIKSQLNILKSAYHNSKRGGYKVA